MDWYTWVADLMNLFTISWKARLKKEKNGLDILFVTDFMGFDNICERFYEQRYLADLKCSSGVKGQFWE